jgi:TonB-linked SusC/RagA family outer membrane protein
MCLFVGSVVYATTGNSPYAQVKTLTIKAENKTFKEVFAEIESKSEFVFLYYDNLINHKQKVFIDIKNQTIDKILDKLFAGTNLSYEIDDRQIIITQRNIPTIAPPAVKAREEVKQAGKIKGKVVDENGDPMPGVTIVVVGSTRGVLTDVDGSFEIEVKSTDKIKFTFLGYQDQTITVGSQQEVFIKMEPKVDELAEVQVVAFGKQKKESVIGSISTVSVDNLKKPVGKISTSLAGQIAGVVGVQRSGEPGAGADFWIRGISTFGNGGSPLVLVDGIERSLDLVDPEDIESFSILKDATATAVYGVRGANGVVLITTKRGKEGKLQINTRIEYGITAPVRKPKLASAGQWIDYYNDISLESSGNLAYTEEDKRRYLTGYDPDLYPNVDWVDEIFKESTDLQRVNFNVSGGSKILRYYVAGSLYFENGIFNAKKGKSYNPTLNYKRYNFRSNFDVNLTPSTVLSVSLANMYETKNRPNGDMWAYMLTVPNIATPTIYSDGTYATPPLGSNPWMTLNQTGYVQDFWNSTQTLFSVSQDLSDLVTKGLELNLKFAWDAKNSAAVLRKKAPSTYYATGRDKDGNLIFKQNSIGNDYMTSETWNGSSNERSMDFEGSITYNNIFDEKHRVGGMFLFNMRERNLNLPANLTKSFPYRNQGIAGRLTYSFKDTYFIEGNFGYNGSENFSPGKKFGFFPSLAVGYLVSNESYFEKIRPIVSLLKLKASRGKIGNDVIGDRSSNDERRFAFYTEMAWSDERGFTFGNAGQNWLRGLATGRKGNDGVTWEEADKTNLGIELGFFDKVTLHADYFYEKRTGIYIEQQSIPSVVGLNVQRQLNIGKMKNEGFDMSLEYNQQVNKDLFLSARGNLTYNVNTKLYDDKPTPVWPYQEEVGMVWGQQRGLVALGLFESQEDIDNSPKQLYGDVRPGDVKYKDINGDGVVDNKDMIAIGYHSVPQITYGFGVSAGWKNFDLSVFFQGNAKATRFVSGSNFHGTVNNKIGLGQIYAEVAEGRWSLNNPNPNAKYPRMAMAISSNNMQNSTMNQRDVSLMRLKNIDFGYTIPRAITKKFGMSTVRVYMQGVNLFTFSKFKLWDPELDTDSGNRYPNMKTINFGMNINF